MGETAKLQGTRPGQFGLNDWLGQIDGAVTPQSMVKFILPVQEMREFQRRYVFSAGSQDLLAGERLVLIWTVPAQEWWRPRTLMFTNKDSGDVVVRVEFSVDNTGNNVYRASRMPVDGGQSQVIYGQDIDGAVGSVIGRFASRLPSTLEPNDTITMTQENGVAIASEQSWILLYELVPQPATALVRGADAGVTVI